MVEETRATPRPMASDDWDLLLGQIEEGKVVPVVGRDLLVIPGKEGEGGPTFYHRALAFRLAKALGVSPADLPKDPDIEDVAFHYLKSPRSQWDLLYATLKRQLQDFRPAVPEPLRQLAAIEPLPLFVSTTCDDLLARALRERPRATPVVERAYLPSASTATSQDLPSALEGGAVAVYSILGRPDEAGDYAVTEEDTLEFVHQLKVKLDPAQGELKNLGARLRQSHLLFLGCGFPDWLMRFFIRTLRGERFFSERPRRRARVADRGAQPDGALMMFLEQYGTRVYTGAPVDFVAELSRRWKDRRRASARAAGAPPSVRVGTLAAPLVLLACGADDESVARSVVARLATWNIGAAVARFRETDEETASAQLDASGVYVAYLSKPVLGDAPDARLLADWQRVERRRQDANRPLATLVITVDTHAREKLRDSRGWPDWLRRSRRLPPGDDVAVSIVEAAFETGRLGVRSRVRLHCVFADNDRTMLAKLERQLAGAKWLNVGHRDKLRPGEDVGARQAEEIAAADVVLLLVSADMLAERAEEIESVMERHRSGAAQVIPILVRSCMVEGDLTELDSLPEDGEAISLSRDADLAWTNVAKAVVLRSCDFVLGRRAEPRAESRTETVQSAGDDAADGDEVATK